MTMDGRTDSHSDEALPGVLENRGTRPFISREHGNKCHFFRGTSSEIWGTGEHKILCANDIKYCYKEPFFRRDTEWDGISDISACLVCFRVFQRTQFRRYLETKPNYLETKPKYRNETLK